MLQISYNVILLFALHFFSLFRKKILSALKSMDLYTYVMEMKKNKTISIANIHKVSIA